MQKWLFFYDLSSDLLHIPDIREKKYKHPGEI